MIFLVLTNPTITLLKEKERDLKIERERERRTEEGKEKTEKAVVTILDNYWLY